MSDSRAEDKAAIEAVLVDSYKAWEAGDAAHLAKQDLTSASPWASSPVARPKDANTSESWNTEFRLMPSAVTVKTWSVCNSYPSPTRR